MSRVNEIVSSLAETTCSMTKVRVYVTGVHLSQAHLLPSAVPSCFINSGA